MRAQIVVGLASLGGLALPIVAMLLLPLRRFRRQRKILKIAEAMTRQHARLRVKRKQLVIHDGYGNYHLEDWIAHANYFIDAVILREAADQGLTIGEGRDGKALRAAITTAFLDIVNTDMSADDIADEDILSGEHYEPLCHNLLEAEGWVVTTTPVTGDQGADLIADAAGRRLIIQCKFYSKPVGNKAVQEAVAAKTFHGGDHAAVVSNAAFTRSARQLAEANEVLLLHHDQLPELWDMIRLPPPKAP